MTLASGSRRKCFWDTVPLVVFNVTTGKPICKTHVFMTDLTSTERLLLSAACGEKRKGRLFYTQHIWMKNLTKKKNYILYKLSIKIQRTYHLQMVPQIEVDGICVVECIQVALMGNSKTSIFRHRNMCPDRHYTGWYF